jgi:hypothetical protein
MLGARAIGNVWPSQGLVFREIDWPVTSSD